MAAPHFPPRVPNSEYFASQKAIISHMINAYRGYQQRFGELYAARLVTRQVYVATGPQYAAHLLQKNHRNYQKDKPSHVVGSVIGNGILTSEGEYWLRQRRLVQPGFHKTQIEFLSTLMAEETDHVLQQLKARPEQEVHQLMTQLALQVVSRALFSKGIDEQGLRLVEDCLIILLELMVMKIRDPLRVLRYKLTGKLDDYWARRRQLDAFILRIVDQRQAEGPGPGDLLDMLLTARDEDTGLPLTREEVLQELMALFLAGFETSANGLSWTLLLLDQHPEARAQLQEEVDRVLGQGPVRFEQLSQLPYTRQVIEESLRLYPPAWIIGREALGPDQIGELSLQTGDNISIFIYGLHRNPAYWPDPEKFMPERMAAEAKRNFVSHQYIPFGGGPRLCIGHQFAMVEMQIALAMLFQRFKVTRTDQRPISMVPSITLRPGDPLMFRFDPR